MSTFFRKKQVRVMVPEKLGLGVGLPAIVAIMPWVPQGVRAPLSSTIHDALKELQQKRKNKE